MDLRVFDPVELVAVARALRDIAAENGTFTDAERDFVEAVAQLHGVVLDARALKPITLSELAAVVRDPHKRKRAVQLAIVASLIEGVPGDDTEQALEDLARALDVTDSGTRVVREVAHGHATLARIDIGRRLGATLFHARPVTYVARAMLEAAGLTDEAVAERYRALGSYAPGTLGRALYDHYRDHGFPLPGETDGAPERIVFHDIGHVLSGYGVDPEGEIQQAAFQAGFMRNDGFVFFLFGVLQFHLGVKITPIADAEQGFFDVKKVLRAAERGAACTVDLSSAEWDLWSVAHEQVSELRARYAIP